MKKVRYMISDAANMMQVESHVLRYWEEELELDVPRNEMGHRYYTEENMHLLSVLFRLRFCLTGHSSGVLLLFHIQCGTGRADKAGAVSVDDERYRAKCHRRKQSGIGTGCI